MNPVYLKRIYNSRYFWWHLTLADIRAKYQRTLLGLLWSIIQPLAMTLLFAFVLIHIFDQPVQETILFIYSGMICWDLIVFASVSGSWSFVNAAPYIKQFPHPIAIYPLRSCLVGMINLLVASSAFLCWAVYWNPGAVSLSWLSLPPSLVLFLFVVWPLAIVCAVATTIFRDFSQLVTLLLQVLWFISPVFFLPEVFINAGIGFLVYYNPVYHLLQLIRAPILEGMFPTVANYGVTIFLLLILWAIAIAIIWKYEQRIILYL